MIPPTIYPKASVSTRVSFKGSKWRNISALLKTYLSSLKAFFALALNIKGPVYLPFFMPLNRLIRGEVILE